VQAYRTLRHYPLVYFIRHGTPDWSRTDLAYHVPPGPSLVASGEREAAEAGRFFRDHGVRQMWFSPLERTHRTAQIAGAVCEAVLRCEDDLRELQPGETLEHVRSRVWPVWERAIAHSLAHGPLALVTHGGPITAMLSALHLPGDVLAHYSRLFDHGNPVPPCGVWKAARPGADEMWDVSLAFVPEAYRSKLLV
jgi:broad specificity phosphatase PhoE